MAIDQVDQTVVTHEPVATADTQSVRTDSRVRTRSSPGGAEFARRVVVLLFGLIQILIGARIVLLILNAREANGLVSAVLNVSQLFVAPFQGILGSDALHAAGSTLDMAAVLAFVGWTVLELIVIWALAVFRRGPTEMSA